MDAISDDIADAKAATFVEALKQAASVEGFAGQDVAICQEGVHANSKPEVILFVLYCSFSLRVIA